MQVNVKADVRKLTNRLEITAKQLPFATALALNAVAKAAADDITSRLPSIFAKQATPFTLRAMTVSQRATKANLTAVVNMKPVQAAYLAPLETGGTETPAGTAFVLPVDIKLNQYSNIGRGRLKRMLGGGMKQAFVGTVKGVGGFWLRMPNGKLSLLADFVSKRSYKPKLDYRKRVEASVKKNLPAAVRAAVAKAMSSAKP